MKKGVKCALLRIFHNKILLSERLFVTLQPEMPLSAIVAGNGLNIEIKLK